MRTTPDDLTVIERDEMGFALKRPCFDPFRCDYVATQGYEGFGSRKRLVTYPAGAISIRLAPGRYAVCESLGEAKRIVAAYITSGGKAFGA